MNDKRIAGILLPIASLPGDYGIGDFGKAAYEFASSLASSGFSLWQILPLNPLGYGHSPYQPFSSFALDRLYIDLKALRDEGLIHAPKKGASTEKIDYEGAMAIKESYLKKAYRAEMKKDPDCYKAFLNDNAWVSDWASFMVFKKAHDLRSWDSWSPYEQSFAMKKRPVSKSNFKKWEYEVYVQYKLYQQWDRLHAHCASLGIQIIGDLPFYVGHDSCDVWAEQDGFLLDRKSKQPTFIAGVPPDYFSATGQRWGNPIYDWKRLEKTEFGFIINRIRRNAAIYDILRLDHFRAFDTYWKIPSSCPTAIEGAWIEPPGKELFETLFKLDPSLQAKIIAEDLGDLRPEVLVLRDAFSFPGMNVIQFTFHDYELEHKGNWDEENMVVYLGTHDNDTTLGFFYGLDETEQARWVLALEQRGIKEGTMNERLIRYALAKKAKTVVLSMQDVLDLDSYSRINVPGIVDDRNWTWKMTNLKDFKATLPFLRKALKESGRSAK